MILKKTIGISINIIIIVFFWELKSLFGIIDVIIENRIISPLTIRKNKENPTQGFLTSLVIWILIYDEKTMIEKISLAGDFFKKIIIIIIIRNRKITLVFQKKIVIANWEFLIYKINVKYLINYKSNFSLNRILVTILFIIYFFCFVFSFLNLRWDVNFFVFNIVDLIGLDVSLYLVFDFYSLIFRIIVCLITRVVIGYSIFYIGIIYSNRFIYLVFFFFLSILILINRGNFFLLILGWDGLGVVSFALVIFYQNEVSIKSGLITIFINRFGDGCIILFMCIFFSFERSILLTGELNFKIFYLGVFLFFLACFTKRAQFPFISWLPAAITAPTPVSSLVHSSTLVTAGVYLIIRFNVFLIYLDFSIISLIRLFTIGVGGFLAIIELDFKKVIAFSTLRQLGLLVFILRFGEIKICFFHLLSHAIFKSFLFIMCGIFISSSFGNQDRRFKGIKEMKRNVFFIIILFSCFNLSGFPLTMGFLSKDLILESFLQGGINFLYGVLFLVFCCFTVCYRMKLFFNIFFYIKIGFFQKKGEFLDGGKLILLFLFFRIVLWGLILEEFIIEDEIFSLSQDYKFIDLLIWGIGIFLYFKNHYLLKAGYSILEYFWTSVILNFSRNLIYNLRLILNFRVIYRLNFFFVYLYFIALRKNFRIDFYLGDRKNFWYLILLFGLFYILY